MLWLQSAAGHGGSWGPVVTPDQPATRAGAGPASAGRPPLLRACTTRMLLRYGQAFAAVAVAVLLTWALYGWPFYPAISRNPAALFYAAVVFAAWAGGLGPGLLATVLSCAAVDVFFVPSF